MPQCSYALKTCAERRKPVTEDAISYDSIYSAELAEMQELEVSGWFPSAGCGESGVMRWVSFGGGEQILKLASVAVAQL